MEVFANSISPEQALTAMRLYLRSMINTNGNALVAISSVSDFVLQIAGQLSERGKFGMTPPSSLAAHQTQSRD